MRSPDVAGARTRAARNAALSETHAGGSVDKQCDSTFRTIFHVRLDPELRSARAGAAGRLRSACTLTRPATSRGRYDACACR